MTESGDDAVTLKFDVATDPADAWRFWIEPGRLTRWMGRNATIDPRRGGEIRVDYGNGIVMRGSFVGLDEPERLAFTWGWEDPAEAVRPGESLVEVTFQSDGESGTLRRLRHSRLPEGERESHLEGWEHFRPRLIEAVAADSTPGG